MRFWNLQHRYDEIINWYKELADKHPDIVKKIEIIGKSYEGREQPAVHITLNEDPESPKIYFQCQIHASELW